MEIVKAETSDAIEILELQKFAYHSEAEIYNDFSIPPLHQTLDEFELDFKNKTFLKAIVNNKIIGSVRARHEKDTCFIERLIVHPSNQNQGIGERLLKKIESLFCYVDRFELFTGIKSEKNLYLYQKLGYQIFKSEALNENVKLVFLEKFNIISRSERIKSHFEEAAVRYDSFIPKVIPYYHELLSALINAIPFEKDKEIVIVDLGCGTGNLSKLIKMSFPNSKILCIDISQKMIELAKKKLSEYEDIDYYLEDFNSLSFPSKYDVILSSLAIHHLSSDNDKIDFYTKIYHALNIGGIFYNLDVIQGPNEYVQKMYIEKWKEFLTANYSIEEINEILADHRRNDSPAILFDQLRWLENIGFKSVDVIWKCYIFAIYGGIK